MVAGINKFVIYTIKNTRTGVTYVGSSAKVRSRWTTHRWQLRNGVHHCKHLQRSWIKHGEDVFTFTVIDECETQCEMLQMETQWIALLSDMGGVYNTATVGGTTLGLKMPPKSAELRRHMSEKMKGRYVSEYTRFLQSLSRIGKPLPEQHKENMRLAALGRAPPSAETRAKLSDRARNISDETRRKRSETAKLTNQCPNLRARRAESARNISDETRQKRSESVRLSWIKRKASQG